jgi:hypothetical protein
MQSFTQIFVYDNQNPETNGEWIADPYIWLSNVDAVLEDVFDGFEMKPSESLVSNAISLALK